MNMLTTAQLAAAISILFLGSLIFGYHISELNTPRSVLNDCANSMGCIPMTDPEYAFATTAWNLGGLPGSLFASRAQRRLGLVPVTYLTALVLTAGAICTGLADSVAQLSIGRVISGVGCGVSAVTTPMWLMDLVPMKYKAEIGSTYNFGMAVGILIAQIQIMMLGSRWRIIFVFPAVLSLLQIILLRFVPVPDEPLVKPRVSLAIEEKDRRGAAIAISLQLLQQLTGINTIFFFSTPVLEAAFPHHAGVLSLAIAAASAAMSLLGLFLLKKFSISTLLITSSVASAVFMMVFAAGQNYHIAWMSITGIIMYILVFSYGLGSVPSIVVPYLVRKDVGVHVQALAQTSGWLGNVAVAWCSLWILAEIGNLLWVMSAVVCVVVGCIGWWVL